MPIKSNESSCQICGEAALREVESFTKLPRITSDCRSFPAGGSLYVCLVCGCVQKVPDSVWLREISEIYAGYAAYYQSGGDEQIVFDRASGHPRRRSDVLVDRLRSLSHISAAGSMLDIGCGNGVTLSAFGRSFPDWRLNGFEIGHANQQELHKIRHFDRLFHSSLTNIDRKFGLVTMVHSLEHFPAPSEALATLAARICDKYLFVEVCNIDENPFDILVADHLMHFSPETLSRSLLPAGFSPVVVATDWVSKEISFLATVEPFAGAAGLKLPMIDPEIVFQRIADYVEWLATMRRAALEAIRADLPFGLFGTSIAATWLAPLLNDRVTFFVDEDSSRIGREHLGRPVVHPKDIPHDAVVFLALAPLVANAIANRLSDLPCQFVSQPHHAW